MARTWSRDLVRASLAVLPAVFLAGAAVSTRLHLRVARHGGGFAVGEVLEQGLEIALWFGLFVMAAALFVDGLSRPWKPSGVPRLATAVATFAVAFILFELVFWVVDGLVLLYLASGALAHGLVSGRPGQPSRQADLAESGQPSPPTPAEPPVVPPRLRPADL